MKCTITVVFIETKISVKLILGIFRMLVYSFVPASSMRLNDIHLFSIQLRISKRKHYDVQSK